MIADRERKSPPIAADHRRTTDMVAVVAGVVLMGVLLSGPRPLSARGLATRRWSGSPRTSPPSTPHVEVEVRPGRSGSGHPGPGTPGTAAGIASARRASRICGAHRAPTSSRADMVGRPGRIPNDVGMTRWEQR